MILGSCLLSPTASFVDDNEGGHFLDRLSVRQKIEMTVLNGIRNAERQADETARERILKQTLAQVEKLRASAPKQSKKTEKEIKGQIKLVEKSLKQVRTKTAAL